MKALEKYLKKGDTVGDIGTGSGILAILAMKLGAKSAYGCDIDETVIDVCKDNAEKNGIKVLDQFVNRDENISGYVVFELSTANMISQKFDFVCANILHNVLNEIMGDLKNLMTDNGIMSLSGILNEKQQVVLDAIARENLKIIDTIEQDQWISFIVKK